MFRLIRSIFIFRMCQNCSNVLYIKKKNQYFYIKFITQVKQNLFISIECVICVGRHRISLVSPIKIKKNECISFSINLHVRVTERFCREDNKTIHLSIEYFTGKESLPFLNSHHARRLRRRILSLDRSSPWHLAIVHRTDANVLSSCW